jgi:hypothetical protein
MQPVTVCIIQPTSQLEKSSLLAKSMTNTNRQLTYVESTGAI